jgi:hypothetical protein
MCTQLRADSKVNTVVCCLENVLKHNTENKGKTQWFNEWRPEPNLPSVSPYVAGNSADGLPLFQRYLYIVPRKRNTTLQQAAPGAGPNIYRNSHRLKGPSTRVRIYVRFPVRFHEQFAYKPDRDPIIMVCLHISAKINRKFNWAMPLARNRTPNRMAIRTRNRTCRRPLTGKAGKLAQTTTRPLAASAAAAPNWSAWLFFLVRACAPMEAIRPVHEVKRKEARAEVEWKKNSIKIGPSRSSQGCQMQINFGFATFSYSWSRLPIEKENFKSSSNELLTRILN